ncbi:MAG TPA: FMN-binding negative transcriptional regulator [Cyclobacteriaceae bacterium]
MFIHSYSHVRDSSEILDFIQQNGFATLVSTVDGKPWATHLPLVLSKDGSELTGHVSRGNKAWRNFSDTEVLCIFQGPHSYISSSWYDHENVPTWNYMAVHVYGTIKIQEGEELLEALKALTNKYEIHSQKPVSVEGMSKSYLEKEIRGIVGVSIKITNIEASFKLSQNRDDKNHAEIVKQLKAKGDSTSAEVAEEMLRHRKK